MTADNSRITEEPLDEGLRKYLSLLVAQGPSTIEFKTGTGRIFEDLAAHWPQLPGWEDTARALCRRIEEMLYPLAARLYAQAVEISVVISQEALALPRETEFETYVVLDPKRGVARFVSTDPDHTLPAAMELGCGVAVLCRPFNYQYHQLHDDRGAWPRHGASALPNREWYNRNIDLPPEERETWQPPIVPPSRANKPAPKSEGKRFLAEILPKVAAAVVAPLLAPFDRRPPLVKPAPAAVTPVGSGPAVAPELPPAAEAPPVEEAAPEITPEFLREAAYAELARVPPPLRQAEAAPVIEARLLQPVVVPEAAPAAPAAPPSLPAAETAEALPERPDAYVQPQFFIPGAVLPSLPTMYPHIVTPLSAVPVHEIPPEQTTPRVEAQSAAAPAPAERPSVEARVIADAPRAAPEPRARTEERAAEPVAERRAPVEERPAVQPAAERRPAVAEERPATQPAAERRAVAEERPAAQPASERRSVAAEERPAVQPVAERRPAAEERPTARPAAERRAVAEERPAVQPVAERRPAAEERPTAQPAAERRVVAEERSAPRATSQPPSAHERLAAAEKEETRPHAQSPRTPSPEAAPHVTAARAEARAPEPQASPRFEARGQSSPQPLSPEPSFQRASMHAPTPQEGAAFPRTLKTVLEETTSPLPYGHPHAAPRPAHDGIEPRVQGPHGPVTGHFHEPEPLAQRFREHQFREDYARTHRHEPPPPKPKADHKAAPPSPAPAAKPQATFGAAIKAWLRPQRHISPGLTPGMDLTEDE